MNDRDPALSRCSDVEVLTYKRLELVLGNRIVQDINLVLVILEVHVEVLGDDSTDRGLMVYAGECRFDENLSQIPTTLFCF